jgi:class 3 adenylate cyclase
LVRRIEEWLGDLGLGEYASRFVENDVDFEILVDLTDQDLEKIGVASLGQRRRLLRAISELNASPAEAVAGVTPPISPQPRRTAAAKPEPFLAGDLSGERRYPTVLFCDLVDSISIASWLDAEERRDLAGAYF